MHPDTFFAAVEHKQSLTSPYLRRAAAIDFAQIPHEQASEEALRVTRHLRRPHNGTCSTCGQPAYLPPSSSRCTVCRRIVGTGERMPS
jgi:hypothetical protein